MYQKIIISFLFGIVSMTSQAQILTENQSLEYAQSLQNEKFITEEEYLRLVNKINLGKVQFKNDIVRFLMQSLYERLAATSNSVMVNNELLTFKNDMYDIDIYEQGILRKDVGYVDAKQLKNLRKEVNTLHKIGLIDTLQKQELFNRIFDVSNEQKKNLQIFGGELYSMYQVLQFLIEKSDFEHIAQRKELLIYLNQLEQLGLFKDSNKQKLIDSIQKGEVRFKVDILPFIENTILITQSEIPTEEKDAYLYLFREVLKVFPSLKLKKIQKKERVESKDLDARTYEVFVDDNSFEINIRPQLLFEDEPYEHNFKLIEMLNKVLALQDSEHRIFYVHDVFNPLIASAKGYVKYQSRSSFDKIGFIKLTKKQFNILNQARKKYSYTYFNPFWYRFDFENSNAYFEYVNKTNIAEFISKLDSLGFFSHLEVSNKESKFNALSNKIFTDYLSIIDDVDSSLVFFFDWEMFDDKQPYKEAFLKFSEASRGIFQPEEITDNFTYEAETSLIGFTFKGKKYEVVVESEGDWYNSKFIELIHKALEEQKFEHRFYEVTDAGQASVMQFLTPAQYDFLIRNGYVKID